MGLRALGVEKGDRVAILSENRPEWAFADLATPVRGARSTCPSTPTLTAGPGALHPERQPGQGRLRLQRGPGAQGRRDPRPGAAPAARRSAWTTAPTRRHACSLDEVRAAGRAALASDPEAVRTRAAEVQPEDLATLIYTSGTTGEPKGVMLTHGNIVSNVMAARARSSTRLGPDDVALSFLPLCHIFERMAGHYLMLDAGRHHRLRRERRAGARQHGRGAADGHVLGAAPLREDVRARPREGRRRPARCARRSSAGRSAWAARSSATRWSAPRPACSCALQARARRQAGLRARSGSARAAACASSSPAARRWPARSRSSSAPRACRSWRATASPRRAR